MSSDPRSWDRAMAARIGAGDEDALAAVYDQYAPLVHGIAVQLLGSADAPDICQEVFLALWERPTAYDPDRGGLRTFLAVVTRRRCIDQLRKTGRRKAREERNSVGAPVAAPHVDEAAFAMMAAERVRAALGGLPEEQRRAIELAYFQGLTFQQVAVATGAAEGTAKSRLRLGLRRLANELAGWNATVGDAGWT